MQKDTDILARNGVDHIVGRCSQELCDDRELVDVVLAWEQGFSLEHLGKDASGTPDVNFDVVLLPGKHDLGRAVVSGRHIARHLRVLDPRKAEVAYFEIAVLVDQNVAGLQVSVNDTRRVNVLQSSLHSR